MSLFGKSLISTEEWTKEELLKTLKLAVSMKQTRFDKRWRELLATRTFIMLFYNYSLRTRISFEAAMTELGGHAQFITPSMMRLKTEKEAGETIEDAAKVMSRYAAGIGIRIAESALPFYGAGHQFINEYARHADVPVINMANDFNHPCQGLADILGLCEVFSKKEKGASFDSLKNKNFLLTWAHGGMARTWSSVQESLLLASRFGMNITVARPDGYDLDPSVYETVQNHCQENNTRFLTTNDPVKSYDDVHVVYSRNWMSPLAYENNTFNKEQEIERAMALKDWITTAEKMKRTNQAFFTHCMPIDRNFEVTDEVANSPESIIYQVAENRLHVQKAVLALTMSKYL